MRKTFIDIFLALTELQKKNYYTHCRMKKPHKIFFVQKKKQCKIVFARGLSIRLLSALGCWKVTVLLLLLQKKC